MNTFVTLENNKKISHLFELILDHTKVDAIVLVLSNEKDKYTLIASLNKKRAPFDKDEQEHLLQYLHSSSAHYQYENCFIESKYINSLNKNNSKVGYSLFYSNPISNASGAYIGFVGLISYSSMEMEHHEKELVKVLTENINYIIQHDQNQILLNKIEQNESDKKFQIIFDSVPEAISFNELPSHKTVSVNKAFIEYSGYTESELLGKAGFELNLWHKEEERKAYRNLLSENGFVENYEAQFESKKGHIFNGLISGRVISVSGKTYLLVIIRNIEKLKQAQEKTRQSEEKFRLLFDSVPDALSISNVDDLAFTEVNNRFLEQTGYRKKDIIGKNGLELNFWADLDERNEYLNLIQKYSEVKNFHFHFLNKDGTVINTLLSAKKIHLMNKDQVLVSTRNIEELIRMKGLLSAVEKKFQMFFHSSPDAISINQYQNEVFVDVNNSFLEETQYTREELIGRSLSDFDLWFEKDKLQYFIEKINTNNEIRNLEAKFKKKNGDIIHTLISASISIINKVPHIITIIRNIEEFKKVQKTLEDSENRYRTIVEKSHSCIISIDNDYKIVYSNERSYDLFGFHNYEVIGQDIRQLVHPDSLELVVDRYLKRQKNISTPDAYEFKIMRKDGVVREVEVRSSVYKDLAGNVRTISQLLDITEAKKAKEVANLLEEKAQNYLDIAAVMMLALNNKGEIIMLNKKACEILEYEEDELIGKNWFKTCLPKNLIGSHLDNFNLLVKEKKAFPYSENKIIAKSGIEKSIAWNNSLMLDAEGNTIGVLSSGEDITEKLSNLRIINRSRAIVIMWKNEPGFPLGYISENIYKLLGYKASEFMDGTVNFHDLIHPDDVERVTQETGEYSNPPDRQYYNHDYYRMIGKDGKEKWIEDRTDIHRNSSGEITHYDGVLLDVTDKKRTEFELVKAKNKAEESDRLKSSFLANMSHEIRTPMNSIIGFAGLLEDAESDEDEKGMFIGRIKKNGELLLNLINDIIDISKIEADQVNFHYDSIKLDEFLKSVNDLFCVQAKEKSISLKYSLSNQIKSISFKSDVNRLRQIMINLLSNALKFTPQNGEVTFACNIKDDYLLFYVKDTGIGIAKSEQEHVFSRFRQAEMISQGTFGGTGLGLSISKGLVEQMGGKIWLESEPNKGSKFFFTLPL